MYFLGFDPLYLSIMGIGLLIGILTSLGVKGAFSRYSRVRARSGLTGAQVAQAILGAHGISDVSVESTAGTLTDHYDPRAKVLRLSEGVYSSNSVAALGVAAHEVGHAIQDAHGYAPLKFRSAWVPVANIGTNVGIWIVIAAALLGGVRHAPMMSYVGLALFGASTVFTLATLPVEFDASRRALVTLQQSGVLAADEMPGARAVLGAAALTYVAAFVSSLMVLLYWAYRLGLFSRSDD